MSQAWGASSSHSPTTTATTGGECCWSSSSSSAPSLPSHESKRHPHNHHSNLGSASSTNRAGGYFAAPPWPWGQMRLHSLHNTSHKPFFSSPSPLVAFLSSSSSSSASLSADQINKFLAKTCASTSSVAIIASPAETKPKDGKSSTQVFKDLFCGGVAGAVSRTAVSPLERIKILLQLQRANQNRKYNGVAHGLKVLFKEEGIQGYLRGNGANVIRIFPYSAVQFASYEWLKKVLNVTKDSHPFRFLSAGAGAGITCVVATYPLDLIRTRLSADSTSSSIKYRGIWHAYSHILRSEGFLATYKGITATIMGIAPYVGLNFATYELLKRFLNRPTNHWPPAFIHWVSGAIAGAVSQTATYPLDVLRRRMQMQGFAGHPAYNNTWHCAKSIFIAEGIRGFYKGMLPNYLKVVPSVSISFVVYEWTKEIVNG
ncbi:Solute carrier family 25 (Mitochondrial carrier protein), member 16 [Balamuthia mandrillaris]